jgi:hypothetical protein
MLHKRNVIEPAIRSHEESHLYYHFLTVVSGLNEFEAMINTRSRKAKKRPEETITKGSEFYISSNPFGPTILAIKLHPFDGFFVPSYPNDANLRGSPRVEACFQPLAQGTQRQDAAATLA